jgi:NADH-quinone oxidoreductase subunit E
MPLQLPPALEAKFTELIGRYPVKRSALIPMMLYAQDHFGFLGDELLDEIARRLSLNIIQVKETLEYYSMLRRKPAGRYHVQVCTNISCMLRGGNELYQHVQKRLGLGNKEVSQSGTFSLEEVECIGACTGAPAIQVNYDFYEDLTPDKIDVIFEEIQDGRKPKPVPVISGGIHERHPAEVPVISRRFGIPNSKKIDVYMQNDGYQALEKALKQICAGGAAQAFRRG